MDKPNVKLFTLFYVIAVVTMIVAILLNILVSLAVIQGYDCNKKISVVSSQLKDLELINE